MKQLWIDYLRVLAVFAVVTTHATANFYNRFNQIPMDDWWLANILNGLSRFAVPMFVMISGFLILGKEIGIKEFHIKRGLRLFPALVFWSVFFVIFDFVLNDRTISASVYKLTVGFAGSGRTYYHLWYLSMFVCLMLFAPFINNYILGKKPSMQEFIYLLLICAFFFFLNQGSHSAKELLNANISWFKTFIWFVPYLISGYCIGHFYERIKLTNKVATLSLILMLLAGITLNYFSATYGIVSDWFVLPNSGILNFVITALIFYLFVNNKARFKDNKLVSSIATASFGIYLVHPVFLSLLQSRIVYFTENLYISMLILLSTTFFLSYFLVILLRQIRVFKLVC